VEVDPVVEAALREVDEVGRRARHAIEVELDPYRAHRRLHRRDRVLAALRGRRGRGGRAAGRAGDDLDRLHHYRLDRVVVARAHLGDLDCDVERRLVLDRAEHWVLRLAGGEPVKVRVVGDVEEELAAAAVRRAGVGHRERARLVRRPVDVLVLDVAAVRARLNRARDEVLEGPVGRAASACAARGRILCVRAAELVHEAGDHAVEMHAVVEAALRKVDEV